MKSSLAEKLLVKLMGWTVQEVSRERPLLQALANFKYNEYHQFSLGTLFLENLVKWLNQFSSSEEKQAAYHFVKSKIIFFSNNQIMHLVQMAFSDKVNPFLIQKTARNMGVEYTKISTILNHPDYKKVKRSSLFVAMSDGARIDYFRRYSGISNEQVVPTYEISANKIDDLLEELKKDSIEKFNTIFLIDDFTASGTSYFRKEEDVLKGKIPKILNSLYNQDNGSNNEKNLWKLISKDEGIDIIILFYIATQESIDKISKYIEEWKTINSGIKLNIKIETIQIITDESKINEVTDKEICEISKKYIDNSIVDKHFKKAKHEKYFLGYDECALPIILVHNTPNNSLPILWSPVDKDFAGLFPRITRHS
jgi:hypothetical protein